MNFQSTGFNSRRRPAVIALLMILLSVSGRAQKNIAWKLIDEETFSRPVAADSAPWVRDDLGQDSPWNAGPLSDGGTFFFMNGGESFKKQLESFHLYRKRVAFGQDGWLTLELAARGQNKTDSPKNAPTLTVSRLANGKTAGLLSETDHFGGILIRNTRPLPARYRVEYELVSVNFGGSRYDEWNYGGRVNGYNKDGAKTLHPWTWGPDKQISLPAEKWTDIRGANGFYYLAIVDYPNPAPHNNVFIHTHRKVVMDSYNVPGGAFDACNPANREFYRVNDNTVDAFFAIPGTKLESKAVMKTECGTIYGGENGRSSYVGAVQLVPELMPDQTYKFAVERDDTGYTLEMSGFFRFVGQKTYRYHRDFIEDHRAIWHFNQSAREYDGAFDELWNYEGPFGKFSQHSWPKGSAYPDYFIIGDPHVNFYEGTAAVTNLRLFVPVQP